MWCEAKTVLLPLFNIKFHSSTVEKHTEVVCVLYPHELQSTTLALSTAHMLNILWARVMSWFCHWKVGWFPGKLILELRARGLQTTPKCPGTKCSGWMEEAALPRHPCWMGVVTSHFIHSHICVHLSLSFELSVIKYYKQHTNCASLFPYAYSTFTHPHSGLNLFFWGSKSFKHQKGLKGSIKCNILKRYDHIVV